MDRYLFTETARPNKLAAPNPAIASQLHVRRHWRGIGEPAGGSGDDEQLPSVVNAINDCHAVLVAKIGACPRDELKAAGIEPVDQYAGDFIAKAALQWFADYCTRVASGATQHQPRGDARIRQGAYTGASEAAA